MPHIDETQLNDSVSDDRTADELLGEIEQLSAPAANTNPAGVTHVSPFPPALKALIAAKLAELKGDAYANGWTAQAWRAIDAWRAANAEDYNERRRHEYAIAKLAKTGKLPRGYKRHPTAQDRADQINSASQKYRDTKPRSEQSEARAGRRARAKQREREAAGLPPRMEDNPNFGRF